MGVVDGFMDVVVVVGGFVVVDVGGVMDGFVDVVVVMGGVVVVDVCGAMVIMGVWMGSWMWW